MAVDLPVIPKIHRPLAYPVKVLCLSCIIDDPGLPGNIVLVYIGRCKYSLKMAGYDVPSSISDSPEEIM